MKLREGTEAEYATYVETNSADPYSKCVVDVGEAYAVALEPRIEAGEKIGDIAKEVFTEVDRREGFGITGFMYGAMMAALSHFWIHGEELRKRHNIDTQIGDEGEKANETGGVLNPALLSLGTKK